MNIEELKINALKNDFDSIKELATRMWTGDGIIKNQDATFELWKKAYELNPNDNLVARRMGSCYRFGYGVQADNNIAKKYYLEAATREDSTSQYFLGKILEENNDVECIEWYEKALLNGDIDSAVILASIYLEGKLINKNIEKTDYYLSIVNDSKNPDAFLDVMRLYYFGTSDGNNKDIVKAIAWCKKAVECGSKIAVGNLATLFKEADLNMDEYHRYIIETAVQYNDEALLCAYKYYRELGSEDNERIAYGYLSKAIDNDYADAYYEMGILYFNGLCGHEVNKEKAIECWQIGYKKKDVCSMVVLGYGYLNGDCVEQNIDLAVSLFEEASDLGSLTATRELGVMYFRGDKVEANYNKAHNYFSSISNDDEDSLAYLGLMHIYGKYFVKDNTQGIDLIFEAIEKGSTIGKGLLKEAFYNNTLTPKEDVKVCEYFINKDDDAESMWYLYLSYKNGNGVEKDFNIAFKWLKQAADHQEPRALLEMSRYYYIGKIVEKDLKKAEELCKLAVLKGNRTAVNNLLVIEKELYGDNEGYKIFISFILEYGIKYNDEALFAAYRYYSDLNDEKYYEVAFNYLKQAFANKNPKSFFKMGYVFYNGDLGRTVDKSKAYEYWLIGSQNDDPYSMDIVGNAYIRGEKLQQNVERGIELLEKAVSAGNDVAALDLAKYYLFGIYLKQDLDKSVEYYKKASDMGNPEAQNEIATYYLQGSNGFIKDEYKAFELLEKAALKDNVSAQFNIYLCYYNGWGTPIDIEKAIYWCEKAAANGKQDAINNLEILKKIKDDYKNFEIRDGYLISYNGCASTITIPEGVTRISSGAFYQARNNYRNIGIAGIVLPASLEIIDENAFSNLLVPWVSFGISEYNEYFSVEDGVLFNKDKTLLIKYPIDKQEHEYVVPNTVKQISQNAFKYARNLQTLVLSSSLESIGEEAIVALSNLQYIDFSKTSLVELPKSVCSSCQNLSEVRLPSTLKIIGFGAFFGDNSLRHIVLPNGLTDISDCAFGNCINLSDVNIPQSVVKIGESAFTDCTSLSYLKIPKNANVNPKAIPEHCKISYYLNNQDEILDASYDLKQNTVISTGKTIDEAIEKGKRLLNIGANEKVNINILEMPKKGFLGIGVKEAKVQISKIK